MGTAEQIRRESGGRVCARDLGAGAALILVTSVLGIVIMRYGFGIGFIQLQNVAGYAFAGVHDLRDSRLHGPRRACAGRGSLRAPLATLAGSAPRLPPLLFLLIPLFTLTIAAYWSNLAYSWQIRERALETGGLPGLFLVKTALPVSAFLMIIQGIAAFVRKIRGRNDRPSSLRGSRGEGPPIRPTQLPGRTG